MKPPKYQCRMYCADYPTCTRTQCSRTPMFLYGVKTVMAEKSQTDPINKKFYERLYNEPRVTKLNN